jgi:hypothetical protein
VKSGEWGEQEVEEVEELQEVTESAPIRKAVPQGLKPHTSVTT